MTVKLTLASASPRRRELLALTGLPFESRAAAVDETPAEGERPADYVLRVANAKANTLAAQADDDSVIVAADTIVVLDGEIMGKPRSRGDAANMLKKLRGRSHEVLSAVVIVDRRRGQARRECCRSEVPMRNYSDAELAEYMGTGDPLDKAGAYAIQHGGFHPVENFAHCFAGVMGLPLCHLTRALRALGVEPAADVPAACQQFNNYRCPVHREILSGAANEQCA